MSLHHSPATIPSLTGNSPDVLWLSVNPSFRRLEQQLLRAIPDDEYTVAHWGYAQTPDEPSDLEVAITLLQDYLKGCDRPLHLVGHGTSGLLGLLYTRRFPHRVKSLTLLGVGCNVALDWKAHYYHQLSFLPCSRTRILTQMVGSLFGRQRGHCLRRLRQLLERDLIESFSLHSPLKQHYIDPESVPVPLMVCGGQEDSVIDPTQLQGWYPWFKQGDRLWLCPSGRHFFYASHSQVTATAIRDFWQALAT